MADDSFVPVSDVALDAAAIEGVLDCLRSGWISSEGPAVAAFEAAFAERVGRRHGIAVANGSAALDVAVAALRLGPGDEVILPTHTIISCAAAIVRAGATPVLVDSDPATWNMDLAQIEARVTPRTRAIMAVHLYSQPVDMRPVLAIAERHGVAVIEDAAQMIGVHSNGRPCGSFGDVSTVSFYPNKHITTGEGGMVLTDDADLAARCRSLRNLCFQPERRFVHEELGWNYRMSNLQAALGLAQMAGLDARLARKRAVGERYDRLLAGVAGLERPPADAAHARNAYWVYGVVPTESIPFDAAEAMRRLAARRIQTRPFFWSMHEQPVFRRMNLFAGERYPVSERLSRRGFYLPSAPTLDDATIDRVARAVIEILDA